MLRAIFLIAFALIGCGSKSRDKYPVMIDINAAVDHTKLERLREKALTYLDILNSRERETAGWIDARDCDALLFNGLLAASRVEGIDLMAARDHTLRWHRTPDQDCYRTGRSGSTISRDMLAGLFWGLRNTRNQRALEQVKEYGMRTNWRMGDGSPDRVLMTSNMINTLYRLIRRDPPLFDIWVDPTQDHQRHVIALQVLIRGHEAGHSERTQIDLMRDFINKDPKNMLFAFIYEAYRGGNLNYILDFLNIEQYFPSDRLPTSSDRCSRWLWERDHNYDPCPAEGKTHSGGDLLFLAMAFGVI